jgi:regulator of sigma E protease
MLLTIVSFILVLSFLVFIHELGHYLAARHMGVTVERFSIGFPPKAFGRKVGETEYVLSWVPLGGYVKLLGQNIDDEDPTDPHNFAAKTKLQRLYILAAGPAMNLVAALLLMPIVYMVGVELPSYRQEAPLLAEVTPGSPAAQAGFMTGDRIAQVAGKATPTWNVFYDVLEKAVLQNPSVPIQVERQGTPHTLSVPATAFTSSKAFGWRPRVPPVVGSFSLDSPAKTAGLRLGDRILAVNGQPIDRWDELPEAIQANGGTPIAFQVRRKGQEVTVTVTPHQDLESKRWLIGISPGSYLERHPPLAAVNLGARRVVELTGATFSFLGKLLSGHGSMKALGGPVKIGVVIGEAARSGVSDLLFLMAVISLQLGIFNLLPIPALDGGHIFLLGVEALKRGPLSAKVRERTQMIGFSLLIALILIVTYNDVLQLIS